ncbi:hypothetical protein DMX08_02635 [Pseudomonas protegens]|uniref:Uncharacterized protein n=1 Tax=Pseudomonas protegens TaxID=380021 RepID=A0A9Q6NAN1_9PSED|nr:hypothetical protein DMX08_02635 [Pseudomonas protegens]
MRPRERCKAWGPLRRQAGSYENSRDGPAHCRSWLASESAPESAARLEGLFAGKPAPTGEGAGVGGGYHTPICTSFSLSGSP